MRQPSRLVDAVTFDLDGLMFNTEELYQKVGGSLLARRGCELTGELLDQMMGRRAPQALQIMIDWHKLDDTPEQLAAETAEIFIELLPRRLSPMPGLLDLLDALEAADVRKGIATSSGRQFVTTVLGQFELQTRFSFVLTAEDIQVGKPAPDVYLLAAQRHGVPPERMMVLEDSEIGCAAAVASGAYTVAIPSGRSRTHSFPGAAVTVESLSDARIYAALGLQR